VAQHGEGRHRQNLIHAYQRLLLPFLDESLSRARTQKINAKLICDANAKSDYWYNRESEMLQVRFSQSAAFVNSAAASDPGLCRGMGVMSFIDNGLS
jgi:hypothetical protein